MFPIQTLFKLIARGSVVLCLVLLSTLCAFGQQKGRITGVVRNSAKTPVAGATVTAINQVTTKASRKRTESNGHYSFRLPAGAYRIMVDTPEAPRFDKENVIVEGGGEKTLDIELQKKDEKAAVQPVEITDGEPPGYAGGPSVDSEPQTRPDRATVRDRWRIGFPEYDRYGDVGGLGRDIQFKKGRWYDPYNQNLLKGDYPIFGNKVFMILSAVDTTTVEQRRIPIGTGATTNRPATAEFFGKGELLTVNHIMQFSFEMFHGETNFRPRNWAIKISPTFSLPNYARVKETGVLHIDPRRGPTRTDSHFSLEEAFAEVKIEDTNANFDFISVRAGIQPFVSDFRGFIYSDNNLGARIFGGFDNNRYQFNAAMFSQLEKDTNSGLNRFDRRPQFVYMANIFRQDFLRKGYTGQLSFLFNDDRRSVEYDRNGFLVRPALVGDVRPHSIKVGYIGFNGDGHLGGGRLGRFNLTNSYYMAIGRDDRNPIAARSVRIRSQMAAAELSLDKDYFRFRSSFFWAQGDKDPRDQKASGFDAILDDVNFIGGQFSFWNRQGIRLTQTGLALVEPNSILPSLRTSKIQGQANFVNPGIFIYNAGLDIELTQKIKTIFNANYMRFHRTEPLEYVLFQNRIRKEIGTDLSIGVAYRPLLINNIMLTFGASTLIPGRGFRDIFTDQNRNCPANVRDYCTPDQVVINPRKPLYSLFASLRFIF